MTFKQITKYSILILIFSLLVISVASGSKKSFLWQAQSQSNTVYLLGTIHVGKREMYPLNPVIEKAFEQASILVAEVNPKTVNQFTVLKQVTYSGNDTLDKHLSKNTYDLLKKRLQELGWQEGMVKKMKPWYVAFMIMYSKYGQMGFQRQFGIESHFFRKANNKKIIGLETVESQFTIFNNLSDQVQELFLYHSITDFQGQKQVINQLISAWMKGDVNAFHSVFQKEITKVPKLIPLFKKLIDHRNKNMIKKIEKYLTTTDTYFIMVGSGHLVGKKGIIQALKRKGFSVNQM